MNLIKVFSEKLDFNTGPKTDTHNENYPKLKRNVEVLYYTQHFNFQKISINFIFMLFALPIKIINQKETYKTGPRIDAYNPNYSKSGGNVTVRFLVLLISKQPNGHQTDTIS